jgi:hypothetical protein
MDYSIGMFLTGLLSGTGLGWYASKLHIHAAYGVPKDLKRDAILYKHLFSGPACPRMATRLDNRVSLAGVQQSGELTVNRGSTAGYYNKLCAADSTPPVSTLPASLLLKGAGFFQRK